MEYFLIVNDNWLWWINDQDNIYDEKYGDKTC